MSDKPPTPSFRLLTPRQVQVGSVLATLLFLAISLTVRYGLHWKPEDMSGGLFSWLLGDVRIHAGYVGIGLLLLAMITLSRRAVIVPWLIVIGNGLLFSDILYHLLIWWFEGDPHFSLFYLPHSPDEAKESRLRWLIWYVSEWLIRIGMLVTLTMRLRLATSVVMAWLLLIFFQPYLGAFLFYVFGQSLLPPWREQQLQRLPKALAGVLKCLDSQSTFRQPKVEPEQEETARLAMSLGRLPLLGGNSAELLTDYDGTIKRLVKDIESAQHHVHLLFYIFANDRATQPVVDALASAVQRGVTCRVLVDAFGSKYWLEDLMPKLEESGVQVEEVLPVGLFSGKNARRDLRNHRKIAVIDGKIGYTGSQNLVDAKFKEDLTYEELMVRVTGPVVLELQYVFVSDWYLETEEVLDSEDCFPNPESAGKVIAQVLPSGPGHPTVQRLVVALLHEARQRVVITTPYFIPDEPLLQAMETAVLRGVEVHLIVSKKMDQFLVGMAQRSYYEELLESGVQIHVYRGNFLHAKHVSFDDSVVMIGSTNIDVRSFRLNAEIAILLYDHGSAARLRKVQESYFRHCETLTAQKWNRRRWPARVAQNVARLFSPLL